MWIGSFKNIENNKSQKTSRKSNIKIKYVHFCITLH